LIKHPADSSIRKSIERLKKQVNSSRLIDSVITNLEDNVFIIISFAFIVILFLLALFSDEQFPDLLGIKSALPLTTTLSVVASALSSILGILVAVLLVSFEILRRTYAHHAFEEIFRTGELKLIFVLYSSTITISVFSIVIIDDSLSIRSVNLFYLSIFLFLICIVILYPCSKAILLSATSKKRIMEIVNRIDPQTIRRLDEYSHPLAYIEQIEENPFFILSEVNSQTIREHDRLTPQLVLIESTKRIQDLMMKSDDSLDNRTIIKAFLIIVRTSANQAIKERHSLALDALLSSIRQVHYFCAEHKVPWHEFIELNSTLKEILIRMMQEDLDAHVNEGMWIIQDIQERHLRNNVPLEDEIWPLHIGKGKRKDIPHDTEKDLQWAQISRVFIDMLYELIDRAIGFNKGELVSIGLRCFTNIAGSAIQAEYLGNLQKRNIVSECYYRAEDLTLKSVREGLYKRVLDLSPFDSSKIFCALNEDTEFSRIPLICFGETLIQLTQGNVPRNYDLNVLGTVGRKVIDRMDESHLHVEALLVILRVFNRIRGLLEAENETPDTITAYFEVLNQVQSLKKWTEEKNKHNDLIEEEISHILGSFKKIKEFEIGSENTIITWPDLRKG
jgi:hypothetical protein